MSIVVNATKIRTFSNKYPTKSKKIIPSLFFTSSKPLQNGN